MTFHCDLYVYHNDCNIADCLNTPVLMHFEQNIGAKSIWGVTLEGMKVPI